MKALVTTIKHAGSDYFFGVSEGKQVFITGNLLLRLNDIVEINEKGGILKILAFDERLKKEELEMVARFAEKAIFPQPKIKKEVDAVAERIWQNIADAAKTFLTKMLLSAPIVVRFHNDVDGASGAYAIYKAVLALKLSANIAWQMQRGISYSKTDAENDLLIVNGYESIVKPLLVLVDFGSSEESNEAVEKVKEKFDIIWLDHHPMPENFVGKELHNYINPWLFGGDSNFTAGLLASLFSYALSGIDITDIAEASLLGDYSAYAAPSQKSKVLATILDIITSDTKLAGSHNANLTPEQIDSLLKNEEKVNELLAYGNERINSLLDNAIVGIKVHDGKFFKIYVVDFEKIRSGDQEKYPLPGRFASRLMDRIEGLAPQAAIVLHYGSYISLRLSKSLQKDFDLLEVVSKIKEKFGSEVESGGGHKSACSIKAKTDESKGRIVSAVVELLKQLKPEHAAL